MRNRRTDDLHAVPKLEHPDDVIVKVTTSAICGSDLHMYQGRTAAQAGLVFGHEVRLLDTH